MLQGKKILLGVTGSIAAYKAAILVRALVKRGAEVKVIMTETAKQFITPLTLATLSKNPIYVEFFNPENGEWNSHISLGEWADLYLIAPATANTMAKAAYGVADNLLLTTYLSVRCPVAMAPAMDVDMYNHPTTQENMKKLLGLGVLFIEPEEGELASGLYGKGRMAEAEDIAEQLEQYFADRQKKAEGGDELSGRKVLVTAGATMEAIDPVRYITNRSTGKMGYAIAEALLSRGAEVVLVSGRTTIEAPKGAELVAVESAQEMYEAVMARFEECDGAVMCAAVADYTPESVSDVKIKKKDDAEGLTLRLKRTHDIAAELGRIKGERVLVGFALETDNEQVNAEAKLAKKNFDFIVLNSLKDKGAGFAGDTNKITIISAEGSEAYPLESKHAAAVRIVDAMAKRMK
ncbi:MAG: bifunctional phosphopantothenoylcysteine decarboxylase/phosphopantothenate--cysteine ligase CoaBC [Tidjanibacter sp.]|nr:bifunctional phosphopantothenoylcysteine decarboxylase/phosphopantothenate--cysteine ligase CoaBC [Tidjanibacter sp.]